MRTCPVCGLTVCEGHVNVCPACMEDEGHHHVDCPDRPEPEPEEEEEEDGAPCRTCGGVERHEPNCSAVHDDPDFNAV